MMENSQSVRKTERCGPTGRSGVGETSKAIVGAILVSHRPDGYIRISLSRFAPSSEPIPYLSLGTNNPAEGERRPLAGHFKAQ